MRRLSAALVFAVCMSAAYHASAHTTLDQPTRSPPPSLAAGAAFDGAHGALVVVGGASPASPAETWIWSGARWRQVTEPGPSSRAEPLLAYASHRSRVVLYGGDRAGGAPPLSDTWEWDGTRWERVDTNGPPARSGAAMAYDARRGRVVLFGGARPSGGGELDDTWEWDGRRWQRMTASGATGSPSGRVLGAMAFDEARGRVVLFGGATFTSGKPQPLGDTWEWDGRAWRRIDVTGPGARDHVAMAYSPALRAIVLHGGGTPSAGMLGDTWRYDGRAWTKLLDAGPARGRHRLAYDPAERTVLLYGGYDGRRRTSELWALRANAWERVTP
jgi:hypothetical protein